MTTSDMPYDVDYQDHGCRFAPACLRCPFEVCLFELPGGTRHVLNLERDAAIRQAFAAGARAVDLAAELGMSRRSVYRVIGAVRPSGASESPRRPWTGPRRVPVPPSSDPMLKVCRLCHREQPRTLFSVDRSRRDGLLDVCKPCDAERRRERGYSARRPAVTAGAQ